MNTLRTKIESALKQIERHRQDFAKKEEAIKAITEIDFDKVLPDNWYITFTSDGSLYISVLDVPYDKLSDTRHALREYLGKWTDELGSIYAHGYKSDLGVASYRGKQGCIEVTFAIKQTPAEYTAKGCHWVQQLTPSKINNSFVCVVNQ